MAVEIRPAQEDEMLDFGAVAAYVYAGAFGDEPDNIASRANKPEWTLCAFVDGVMASTFSTLPFKMSALGNTVELAIAARAVGLELQGRVAALRISFNRFGGAMVPLAMGALAEVIGLEGAFYVVGALGVLLVGLLAIWVARSPDFGDRR